MDSYSGSVKTKYILGMGSGAGAIVRSTRCVRKFKNLNLAVLVTLVVLLISCILSAPMPRCKYCGSTPYVTYCPSFYSHQDACKKAHDNGMKVAKAKAEKAEAERDNYADELRALKYRFENTQSQLDPQLKTLIDNIFANAEGMKKSSAQMVDALNTKTKQLETVLDSMSKSLHDHLDGVGMKVDDVSDQVGNIRRENYTLASMMMVLNDKMDASLQSLLPNAGMYKKLTFAAGVIEPRDQDVVRWNTTVHQPIVANIANGGAGIDVSGVVHAHIGQLLSIKVGNNAENTRSIREIIADPGDDSYEFFAKMFSIALRELHDAAMSCGKNDLAADVKMYLHKIASSACDEPRPNKRPRLLEMS